MYVRYLSLVRVGKERLTLFLMDIRRSQSVRGIETKSPDHMNVTIRLHTEALFVIFDHSIVFRTRLHSCYSFIHN